MPTISALEYLTQPDHYPAPPVCALFGTDMWSKHEVLAALRDQTLSGESREFSISRLAGEQAQWRDVMAELSTASLFGDGRQMVILEEADEFVSEHRGQLEAYVERPAGGGVLVLAVGTWQANTRLYKAIDAGGLQIRCGIAAKNPATELGKWLPFLARRHQLKLAPGTADLLLEMVGDELGLLDQQLAKFRNLVPDGKLTPELVRRHCGTWRTQSIWKIIDAALDCRTAESLTELDRLLASGEHPIPVLAAMTSQLRKLVLAGRAVELAARQGRRMTLLEALRGAKVYNPKENEQRLKNLGRHRVGQLPAMLQEVDLALKDYASREPLSRFQLERLIVAISARELNPRLAKTR